MTVWKVKFESGVAAYFETYEALEEFLDAMIVTSNGDEREYWSNTSWEKVNITEQSF